MKDFYIGMLFVFAVFTFFIFAVFKIDENACQDLSSQLNTKTFYNYSSGCWAMTHNGWVPADHRYQIK